MKNGQIVQEAKPEMRDVWAKEKDATCLFSRLRFQLHSGFVLIWELKHVIL